MKNARPYFTPKEVLNKAYRKVKINRKEIELFKANLKNLLHQINESESEEFHKNIVSDFLKKTYYGTDHFINTKGRTDLVIHNSGSASGSVGVIIEAKKPGNKSEMVRTGNLNTKAFHELILYYLRERITGNNLEIKYLIATNIFEWFIFDAHVFEKEFAQDKQLVKKFIDFEEGRLGGQTTDFFYKEIAQPAVAAISHEIAFTWFDIRDYEKPLKNDDKKDDSVLIALYKLLSPEHLLKLPFANDSNSLDKSFYTELLHFIGLTEIKEGSKKLIQRKKEGQRNSGSLLESTIVQLDHLDKISRLPKPSLFGANNEERLFNVALELSITWINRILFLKLLEAQLIKYHKGDKAYSFLNLSKIKNFDDLNSLFFSVLARKPDERDHSIKELFARVPYLNSSLFEPTELEHQCVFISQLKDEKIPLLSSTVIKNNVGQKRTGELPVIEYLFEFLNAYDFASEGSEEIQEENKRLINASVLGLIFEKINGYKDGSFFTPGFITMYMCRETIRRAVVQKFNERKGWNCENLPDLYDKIEDRREANEIINELKICDPAVGSGHFLVSALNEIIAVKSELKILCDRNGKRLKEYDIAVENDELVITDDDGELFEYNPQNSESRRVQEALFHEKELIIENCLFGVDINPNSVKICRLRLWIELLKNAYYRMPENDSNSTDAQHSCTDARPCVSTQLETLPNIDINIKCGNSLISRYALDADIKQALRKSKWSIDSYRLAIMSYRNAQSKEEKRELEKLISTIKNDFESEIATNDKRLLKLNKAKGELYALTNQNVFFEKSKAEKAIWNKQVKSLTESITKLEAELDEIRNNKIYENAFEWRFEFPEVLNDEGDFVGFDVVIGNPPYGITLNGAEKEYLNNRFIKITGEAEIYCYFIELGLSEILRSNGLFSYITTNTVYYLEKFSLLREKTFLTNKLISLVELEKQVFSDAPDIVPAIYVLEKRDSDKNIVSLYKSEKTKKVYDLVSFLDFKVGSISQQNLKTKDNYTFTLDTTDSKEKLIKKLNELSKIKSQFKVVYGIKTGENKKFVSKDCNDEGNWKKCASSAKNIEKYLIKWNGDFLNVSKELAGLNNINYEQPKILIQYIRKISMPTRLVCALDEKGEYYPLNNFSFIVGNNLSSLKILFAIMNSFLMNWYFSNLFVDYNIKPKYIEQLPLPDSLNSSEISEITDKILSTKKTNSDLSTKNLEDEIDQLVYQLYGLTEEEIRIVELNSKI